MIRALTMPSSICGSNGLANKQFVKKINQTFHQNFVI